jgi:hypothetical protein
MLTVTLAQLKSDIQPKMKGTSIRQIQDFYGTAATAANRMLARIDTEETRRTVTLATPFYDNVNDYPLAVDYKRMIDIRPQANRIYQPGDSHFDQTAPRQFNERLSSDSFSIRWNNMVRTLRSQVLPVGNCSTFDTFDGPTANGLWVASVDASGIYTEPLNFIQGSDSMGLNLSGATGQGIITNLTAAAQDVSAFLNEDASFMYVWIPIGTSARFTSFTLVRGDSNTAYRSVTVTAKADGTAFSDGWNFLLFQWSLGTNTGVPTNTLNTYRTFTINYTAGTAINGFLLDSWTNDLGTQYEMEYYSEYLFRTAAGVWIQTPTLDSDLVNVGPASYEILKTEMMVDITQQIRTGAVAVQQLTDWRLMLNGQPQSRYVKDPPYHGLYFDYMAKFPSSAIPERTKVYDFDL